MATGKMNTTLLAIYVGGVKINGLTDASLSMTTEMRDCTTKDSAGVKEYATSFNDATMSFSGIYDTTATYGVNELTTAQLAKTLLTIVYKTAVSGDDEFASTGYLTQLDVGSPGVEDNGTFSGTIQCVSAVVLTTTA